MTRAPEGYVDATFFAQVEPRWSNWQHIVVDGERQPKIDSAKVTGLTQTRPQRKTPAGSVIVKLTLRLPESVFRPLQPSAIITVPADLAQINAPLEVVVEEHSEEEESA